MLVELFDACRGPGPLTQYVALRCEAAVLRERLLLDVRRLYEATSHRVKLVNQLQRRVSTSARERLCMEDSNESRSRREV